ncbi:MAG: regulator of ribonuclease activity A [Candidatus Azotimanducaceae bacterium]|jgi:regulator of ribonuclease activity A
MSICLPDLCDEYPEFVNVIEPMFGNFGGRDAFGGEIVTIKCHEDNSLVASQVKEPGTGKVLVVDGGGSMRCGLLGDNLALKAMEQGWEGIIVYGCIRDVDIIAELDLGVQALASHPKKSVKRNIGLLNELVSFGGVDIKPGHYIYADNNGVLVSSKALV